MSNVKSRWFSKALSEGIFGTTSLINGWQLLPNIQVWLEEWIKLDFGWTDPKQTRLQHPMYLKKPAEIKRACCILRLLFFLVQVIHGSLKASSVSARQIYGDVKWNENGPAKCLRARQSDFPCLCASGDIKRSISWLCAIPVNIGSWCCNEMWFFHMATWYFRLWALIFKFLRTYVNRLIVPSQTRREKTGGVKELLV